MTTRQSTLYRRTNDGPPIEVSHTGLTRARANLRHQMSLLLRDGWRIASDQDDSVAMQRGSEYVYLHIDAASPPKNAPGAGRPVLADAEPTVRRTSTLPASVAARIEEIGDGNFSLGVRRLLER